MNFRGQNGFPMSPSSGSPIRGFYLGSGNTDDESSRSIDRYRDEVEKLPDVREEKVDDLRDAVERGDYHVESEKIAKRVVDEALKEAVQRDRSFPS